MQLIRKIIKDKKLTILTNYKLITMEIQHQFLDFHQEFQLDMIKDL